MNYRYWRNLVEIIGIISIVAGLALVAWEIRQANRIAKAQTVMELAAQYNEFNSSRFENPDVADLSVALSNPDQTDVSETQRSMMAGTAWHFANILWSAQKAYDSGLLSTDDILFYQSHLTWMLKYMPGLQAEFMNMYDTIPWVRSTYVFQPLVEFACESRNECVDILVDE
jgi:hypothetical protein